MERTRECDIGRPAVTDPRSRPCHTEAPDRRCGPPTVAMTETALAELLSRDLSRLDVAVS